jgi:hypothetical protein
VPFLRCDVFLSVLSSIIMFSPLIPCPLPLPLSRFFLSFQNYPRLPSPSFLLLFHTQHPRHASSCVGRPLVCLVFFFVFFSLSLCLLSLLSFHFFLYIMHGVLPLCWPVSSHVCFFVVGMMVM